MKISLVIYLLGFSLSAANSPPVIEFSAKETFRFDNEDVIREWRITSGDKLLYRQNEVKKTFSLSPSSASLLRNLFSEASLTPGDTESCKLGFTLNSPLRKVHFCYPQKSYSPEVFRLRASIRDLTKAIDR